MAKKYKVYIGIGHGGSDPGAVANGVKEKNANLVIGMACAEELERHGVEVMQPHHRHHGGHLRKGQGVQRIQTRPGR